jgi:hypothetical protein
VPVAPEGVSGEPGRGGPLPPEASLDAEATPEAAESCGGFHTPRDRRNLRRFHLRVIAATLLYLGATAALRHPAAAPVALAWLLTGLAWLLAVVAMGSYLAFLRQADELLRRIELEGLALGFGAGAVFALLYPLLVALGAPDLQGEATALVMMVSWAAGSWLAGRRYSGNTSGRASSSGPGSP